MKVILADGKLIFLEVVLNTWSPPPQRGWWRFCRTV